MPDTGERLAALEATIKTEFKHLNDRLDENEKRLWGNGQPGEIEKLWQQVRGLKSDRDRLTGFGRGMKAMWTIISAVAGAFGYHLVFGPR